MTVGWRRWRARKMAATVCGGLLAAIAVPPLEEPQARAEEDTVVVVLNQHQFEPQVVRVRPGQTIRFDNADDTLHSLTLLGREDVIGDVFVDPATSYTVRIPADMPAGTYDLACTIHVDMRARLSVAGP
jgi:plastocyanin